MDNTKGIGKSANTTPSVSRSKTHLLGIGINDYRHWGILRNAVKDLDDVVAILLSRYAFAEPQICLLKNEAATRRNIVNTLHRYTDPSLLGEDDSLLIYFSGHGFLDENEDGYWVPVDSEKDDIDSFIPNLIIQSKIKSMKCRHVLLISDSCFSGSLIQKGTRQLDATNLVAQELERKKSRWLITSGGRDETVSDGQGANSPFAEAIISELKHNLKSRLIVDEFALSVRSITRGNAAQMPQVEKMYQVGDMGGRFVFHLKDHEAEDWQAALQSNDLLAFENFMKIYPLSIHALETQNRITAFRHAAAWARAEDRNTETAYFDYIRQYPNGQFRDLAKKRMTDFADDRAWQVAVFKNSLVEYLDYLEKYPTGRHAAEAQNALDDFEKKQRAHEAKAQAEATRLENEKAEKEAKETTDRAEADRRRTAEAARLEKEKEAKEATDRAEADHRRTAEAARLEKEKEAKEATDRAEADHRRTAEANRLQKEKEVKEAAIKRAHAEAKQLEQIDNQSILDEQAKPFFQKNKATLLGTGGLLVAIAVWVLSQNQSRDPLSSEPQNSGSQTTEQPSNPNTDRTNPINTPSLSQPETGQKKTKEPQPTGVKTIDPKKLPPNVTVSKPANKPTTPTASPKSVSTEKSKPTEPPKPTYDVQELIDKLNATSAYVRLGKFEEAWIEINAAANMKGLDEQTLDAVKEVRGYTKANKYVEARTAAQKLAKALQNK